MRQETLDFTRETMAPKRLAPPGWVRGCNPGTVAPLTGSHALVPMYPGSALATLLGWPAELGPDAIARAND